MKETTVIYADAKYVECPYCGEKVGGWCGDPTGEQTNCDECEKTFKVSDYADVELDY